MKIKYPKGFKERDGFTKIAISFSDELFKLILKRAKHEKKTFNAMVVDLCVIGDMDLTDSDRHEEVT